MKPEQIREAYDTAITAVVELGAALEVLRDARVFEGPDIREAWRYPPSDLKAHWQKKIEDAMAESQFKEGDPVLTQCGRGNVVGEMDIRDGAPFVDGD